MTRRVSARASRADHLRAEAQRAFADACGGLPTPAEYAAQRDAKRARLAKWHREQARRRAAVIESFARAMGGE